MNERMTRMKGNLGGKVHKICTAQEKFSAVLLVVVLCNIVGDDG